jgi:GTP-binding protein HflX
MIVVLNKIDRLDSAALEELQKRYPEAVSVSAKNRSGLDELARRMDVLISGATHTFRFPNNRHDLAALLHRNGSVLSEQYGDEYIQMEARAGERVLGTLREWIVLETGDTI